MGWHLDTCLSEREDGGKVDVGDVSCALRWFDKQFCTDILARQSSALEVERTSFILGDRMKNLGEEGEEEEEGEERWYLADPMLMPIPQT